MKTDDRLTRWNGKKWVLPQGCGSFRVIALAAYENTDLTPDEVLKLKGGAAPKVEMSVFDKETTIENCTVQILENTVTGEVSVGWRKNEAPLHHGDLIDRDALIESFRTSGQFDISELGAIIPIIEEQPVINMSEEDNDECID